MKSFYLLKAVVAGMVIIFSGCDFGSNPKQDKIKLSNKVIVAATTAKDYSAGNVGVYSIGNDLSQSYIMPISSDNNVKVFDTCIYFLERGDAKTIIKINGHSIVEGIVDKQTVVDANNLHDIAFVSQSKAYVTAYGSPDLIGFNPLSGKTNGKKISLKHLAFAGAASPNMDNALCFGKKVYVGLHRYSSDFISGDTGMVVVIDSETDAIEKEILLKKIQPQGMYIYGEKLYIACTGTYGMSDGAIVAIDLSTDELIGNIIDEAKLGGDVSDVLIVSETKGYAIVADLSFANILVSFNPATGKIISSNIKAAGQPSDFLLDDGKLYIASRSEKNAGIIVLDVENDKKVSGPHNVGLPPNKIALLNFGD